MRKSILLLSLATILSALAVGCMPATDGKVAFFPRAYPYVPSMLPDPGVEAVVHK